MYTMQTVLITGGSGLVGKALSVALLAKGYKVIILSRRLNSKPAIANLSYAYWNVKKQQIDLAAVQQADHIVHLAGAGVVAKKWTPAYQKEIVESRTDSSRLLLDMLKNNACKVKTVVSASAIGWYGADQSPVKPFIETDEFDHSFLGNTCKLWEAGIEPVTSLGIRLVICRIGIVLSNDGGALAEFKKPIKLGAAAILGHGKQLISWIHIDDLCRLFTEAIENDALQGIYNAVSPCPVSNKELTLTLAKAMNGKFYLPIYVPAFVLKWMMGERSIEILKSTTVSCKKIMDTHFQFNYNTIEQALVNLIKK